MSLRANLEHDRSRANTRPKVVVVGGGIGGLVSAASLARAGVDVTLLEAQSYLGGCAGTFYRKKYRFDAGATVAAGFGPGGLMPSLAAWLGVDFGAKLATHSMAVHAPGKFSFALPSERADWRTLRREVFGASPEVESFWTWQEQTAATAWGFGDQLPPWPANSAGDWLRCVSSALSVASKHPSQLMRPGIVLDARRPLSAHLPADHAKLSTFVDGLLLITSQATSERALALYGAAALDFPWRGIAHLEGGMGGISDTLCAAIRRHGGRVLTQRRVTRIVRERSAIVRVETEDGQRFEADQVVANLPPWNIRELLDLREGLYPESLARLDDIERDLDDKWGAMVVHAGVDEATIDPAAPLHHQVHLGPPSGEGNTVFVSVSPGWDRSRAPAGKRAVTITTHTRLGQWWEMLARDPKEYAFRKATYQDRLLEGAELAIPGFRLGLERAYAGTPVTYESYTGRKRGWVGGMPQTDLGNAFSPSIDPGLYMVGDSLFPGQSTLAVSLSALRVVSSMLARLGLDAPEIGLKAAQVPA